VARHPALADLPAEEMLAARGWSLRYTRVRFAASDGDTGFALIDTNGDGTEIEDEQWHWKIGDGWVPIISSGPGGPIPSPGDWWLESSWNPDVVYVTGFAPGRQSVALVWSGEAIDAPVHPTGSWMVARPMDSPWSDGVWSSPRGPRPDVTVEGKPAKIFREWFNGGNLAPLADPYEDQGEVTIAAGDDHSGVAGMPLPTGEDHLGRTARPRAVVGHATIASRKVFAVNGSWPGVEWLWGPQEPRIRFSPEYSVALPLWGMWPADVDLPPQFEEKLHRWEMLFDFNFHYETGWMSTPARDAWSTQAPELAAELRALLGDDVPVEVDLWPLGPET
jgi:hypothetical protein